MRNGSESVNSNDFLTLEDLSPEGKTILIRADINTPVDPKTGALIERMRIEEAAITLRDLGKSKLVLCSHQGRVGRDDYIPLEQHAVALTETLGKKVEFIDDIYGPYARKRIAELNPGEILLLDNLRFSAEEANEYQPEAAAKTQIVHKLSTSFDAFVLDAFPTAHRAHPSVVGFPQFLPTAGGRLVIKELKAVNRIQQIAKGPFTAVLGGSKVSDRIEAMGALIENKRADSVLLTGVAGLAFLKAAGKLKTNLGLEKEEAVVEKAARLMRTYPEVFLLPDDLAIEKDGERYEVPVDSVTPTDKTYDIGGRTISKYEKIIRSSGTVFMSGPAGAFERKGFGVGTEELLRIMATSYGTTIVSGGHLSTALKLFNIHSWIDHVSSAGGALILYLAGKKLPLIESLNYSAKRYREGGYQVSQRN
ncbi:MAG TPA: phosphoglycerate kinase [Conexivisphaerales archaeon]|nr:phosphoglycerate kinase [Conexivisphaerales archaeon]